MNSTFLLIIVVLLIVLIAVVAYNLYQENQYRKSIRHQFGHADQDALMQSRPHSVRDGKTFGFNPEEKQPLLRRAPVKTSASSEIAPTPIFPDSIAIEMETDLPSPSVPATERLIEETVEIAPIASVAAVSETERSPSHSMPFTLAPESEPIITTDISPEPFVLHEETTLVSASPETESIVNKIAEKVSDKSEKSRRLLLDLDDLARNELLWFDKRFDYMGYVSLYEAKELHALPRLSSGHRFQIVGCTMDGRFQAAEPIPGVLYQAFVIGLQSVSRNGLATADELNHFAQQVQLFANKMDGEAKVADVAEFLTIATPLDELCARVDQTIAIHLVSRANVLGTELKAALESVDFELSDEGVFELMGVNGDTKYTIAALDGSVFTESLLASQPYKGFSMLFDITRIPNGEDDFNEFMNLALKLAGNLNLDLVDDQVRPLSTDWLKEVRRYVGARQAEMEKVGIMPASTLAKRLFS